MSKKAFPINRVNIDPPKPVRVAPNPPIALPEREPRNIWVMIGVGRCRRRRRGDFGGVSVGARRAVGPDRKIARMATFCLTMSLYGFSDTRAYPPGVADFTSAPHVPLTCWNTWGGVDQFDVGIGADD